jgi:hypothetical protein
VFRTLCSENPTLTLGCGSSHILLVVPDVSWCICCRVVGQVASLLSHCESLQVNLCQAVGDIMQSVFCVGCLRLVTVGPHGVTSHLILAVCILKENISSTGSFCHQHENIRQENSKTLP